LASLLHTKIKVEEPFKSKSISQCLNCQEYGHTKAYCSYPSRCVRCNALHQSSTNPNPRDTPPKCALCHYNYLASYKAYSAYKDLQRCKKPASCNNFFLLDNIRDKSSDIKDSHPTIDTPPKYNPS